MFSLITGCSEISVFLGLADKAGTIQDLTITEDGHLQVQLKSSSRIKNPNMAIYISKMENLPSGLQLSGNSADMEGPLAFKTFDLPNSMAPSKREEDFVQATQDNSVVIEKDIESDNYYLIEIKNRNQSVSRYKTTVTLAKVSLAPVNGLLVIDNDSSVHISWLPSTFARDYEFFKDESASELLTTTSETVQDFVKADLKGLDQIWVRAKRGRLHSRTLTPILLPNMPAVAEAVDPLIPTPTAPILPQIPPLSMPITPPSDVTPPIVNVGADVLAANTYIVNATASDSGSGIATYSWTKVSGAGVISFGTANAAMTTVSASSDDTYVLRLTVTDGAGNSSYDEVNFVWDSTAPSAPLSPGFAASYSTSFSLPISWGASTDTHMSGYHSKICTANDCATGCISPLSTTNLGATHSGVEGGVYYACVQAEDSLGNQSAFVPSSFSVTVDSIAPTATSMSIAGGASYATSTAVTLTLAATGASQMFVSNTAGCATSVSWEAYATSKSWTLAQTNAQAEVFVKYRDAAGNESACISDTIIHDNTVPSGDTISINGNAASTSSTNVTLTLAVTETNPKEMFITNTSGCTADGTWEAFATTKSWVLGQTNATATVYVRYRDAAGNTTSCINDTITHSAAAPTGASVAINGNAGSTTAEIVTLTLAATNATEMYITSDYGCGSGGVWETYSASKSFRGVIDYGDIYVYVKFRNASNVETSCVSDSITFSAPNIAVNGDFGTNLNNWTQSPASTFARSSTSPLTNGAYARSNPSAAGTRNCMSQIVDLTANTADHRLEFDWTYNVGFNSDTAEFLVDGVRVYTGDGQMAWTTFSTNLTAGSLHTIQWCFDNIQGLAASFIGFDKIKIVSLYLTAPVFKEQHRAGGMDFTSTKSSNLESGYLFVVAPANTPSKFYPRDGQSYTNGTYEGDTVYVGSPTLSTSVTGLQANDQLWISVFAFDSSYNYSSAYNQVHTIKSFYYQPEDFRIETRSSGAYLQWPAAPAGSGVTGYIILRQPGNVVGVFNNGQTYNVGDVINGSTVVFKGSALNFTDTGLSNGTTYNYVLHAIGPGGNTYQGAGYQWIKPKACGGLNWGNACWYLSAASQSCKDLCIANSAAYDYTSMKYFLYQKTANDCRDLAVNLGYLTPPASSIRTINSQKFACSVSGTQISYSTLEPTYNNDGSRAETYQSICACN